MSDATALVASTSRAIPAIIPQNSEDFKRLADMLVYCEAIPKSYGTGDAAKKKTLIAILKGAELGWTPMVAVQSLYVVNNIPTLYGDGVMALVRGSGKLEYCKEWIGGEGDEMTGFCEVKRKGEPEAIIKTFSKADALKAGLLGKQGPWQQYPKRMLQMRARAFALRDVFADVLMGVRIREEVEDHEREETPAPTVSPFSNKVEAIDVEVEDTRARGPDGEILTDEQLEAMQADNMAAATDPAAPFQDDIAALEAMRSSLETFNTAKDVDEYVAIWADMVTESAIDASVITTGRRMAATRKAQWSKAKA